MAAAKAYQDYQKALTELAPVATSRKLAYQTAAQVFGEEAAGSKSPFYVGQGAVLKIRGFLGGGPAVEEVAGKLMAGSVDFLWVFVCRETSCQLQSQWEQEVVAETQGASNWQKLVLGQDGLGWKYLLSAGT